MTVAGRFRRATEPISGAKLFSRSEIASHLDHDAALDRGAFLARLWALFGPAESCDDGFRYELCDEKTGLTFTAYSGASGPSYGGYTENRARLRRMLDDFERLLARTAPVECELACSADEEYGGGARLLGFRAGRSFDRDAKARPDPRTARTHEECVAIAAEHAGRYPRSGWQACLAFVIDVAEGEASANDEAGSTDDDCLGFTLDDDDEPALFFVAPDASPRAVPLSRVSLARPLPGIAQLWLDAFARWKIENAR